MSSSNRWENSSNQNFNVRQGPQKPREWPNVGEAMHIGGDAYRSSKVFIGGPGDPTETLTVSGHISGSGVVFTSAGHSADWQSTYSTMADNSGGWILPLDGSSTVDYIPLWHSLSPTKLKDSIMSQSDDGDGNKTVTIAGSAVVTGDFTVQGLMTSVSSEDVVIKDKLITLNKGGYTNSADGVGFQIEEANAITGYIKTKRDNSNDDNLWTIKSPDGFILTLDTQADSYLKMLNSLEVTGTSISKIDQDVREEAEPVWAGASIGKLKLAIGASDANNQVLTTASGDLHIASYTSKIIFDPAGANQPLALSASEATTFGMASGENAALQFIESDSGTPYLTFKTKPRRADLSYQQDSDEHVHIHTPLTVVGDISGVNAITTHSASVTAGLTVGESISAANNIFAEKDLLITGNYKLKGNGQLGTSTVHTLDIWPSLIYYKSKVENYIAQGQGGTQQPGISWRNTTGTLFSIDGNNVLPAKIVGVNTSSPNHALDVRGDISVDEYIYHNEGGGVNDDTYIRFRPDKIDIEAGGKSFIYIEEDGVADLIEFNQDRLDIDYRISSLDSGNAFYLRGIDGNIGIGSFTPDVKLTVQGSISATGSLSAAGDGYNYLRNKTSIGTAAPEDWAMLTVVGNVSASGSLSAGPLESVSLMSRGADNPLKIGSIDKNDLNIFLNNAETLQLTRGTSPNIVTYTSHGGTGMHKFGQLVEIDSHAKINQSLSALGGDYNYLANWTGIGTSMPSAPLTVVGNISASGSLSAQGTDPNYFAGSVGIGTITPNANFEIAAGSALSARKDITKFGFAYSKSNQEHVGAQTDTYKMQYSDNGSAWTDVTGGTIDVPHDSGTAAFQWDTTYSSQWSSVGYHQYWRIVKTSSPSYWGLSQLAEVYLFEGSSATAVPATDLVADRWSVHETDGTAGGWQYFNASYIADGQAEYQFTRNSTVDVGGWLQLDLNPHNDTSAVIWANNHATLGPRVGINTRSPIEALTVAGSISARDILYTNHAYLSGNLDVHGDTNLDGDTIIGNATDDSLTINCNTVTLPGDTTFDCAGDITLDADGADIIFKDDNVESGRITQYGATSLTLDVVGDLYIDAGGSNIQFRANGSSKLDFFTDNGGDWTIKPMSNKDIIFHAYGGYDIVRIDSSAKSLLMAAARKIEFRFSGTATPTEYINTSALGQLDIDASTTLELTAPTIELVGKTINLGENDTDDVALHFLGSTASGLITWDEDVADGGLFIIGNNIKFNEDVTLGDASGDTIITNAGIVTVNNKLNFDSNTFVIDPTDPGFVGIGTASPTTKLHIEGSDAAAGEDPGQLALGYSSTRISLLSTDSSGNLHIAPRSGQHATFHDRNVNLRKIVSENAGDIEVAIGNTISDTFTVTDDSSNWFTVDGDGNSAFNISPAPNSHIAMDTFGRAVADAHIDFYDYSDLDVSRTAGTYSGVTGTTDGSGTVGTFNITVDESGAVIEPVVVVDHGIGHAYGDTITIADIDLGGGGAENFTMKVNNTATRASGTRNGVTGTTDGSGTVGTFNIVVNGVGAITSVTIVDVGNGHSINDTITIADSVLGNAGVEDFTMDVAKIDVGSRLTSRETTRSQIRAAYSPLRYANISTTSTGVLTLSTVGQFHNTGTVYISGSKIGVGIDDPDHSIETQGAIHLGEMPDRGGVIGAHVDAPSDGDGGVIYTNNTGHLFWKSHEKQLGLNLSRTGMNKNANVKESGSDLLTIPPPKMSNAGGFAGYDRGIDAQASGSLAFGYTADSFAYDLGSPPVKQVTSFIRTGGFGDFAGGFADEGGSDIFQTSTIVASGSGNGGIPSTGGAFAFGHARLAKIQADRPGAFALGEALGEFSTASVHSTISAYAPGAFAMGYANNAHVDNVGTGSIVIGAASQPMVFFVDDGSGNVTQSVSKIYNKGAGSIVGGFAYQAYDGTSFTAAGDAMSTRIENFGTGNVVMGYAKTPDNVDTSHFATTTSMHSYLKATAAAKGAFCIGYATSKHGRKASVQVQERGAFAFGYANSSNILAAGKGSFAGGFMESSGDPPAARDIKAEGDGSFAFGRAKGAHIQAIGTGGSFAGGYAKNDLIQATQPGSFAWGYSLDTNSGGAGQISANAKNAVQFGQGTNSIANSLAVGKMVSGKGLRLKGDGDDTVTLRNGDFWCDGTDVFVRTGDVTKNLSNI